MEDCTPEFAVDARVAAEPLEVAKSHLRRVDCALAEAAAIRNNRAGHSRPVRGSFEVVVNIWTRFFLVTALCIYYVQEEYLECRDWRAVSEANESRM